MIDLVKQLLLAVLLIANTNYGMPAPFLPVWLQDRGVTPISTGVIFGIFSVSSAIASLLAGAVVDRWGHRPMLVASQLCLAATVASFGLIERLHDETLIIVACIALRIAQGKSTASHASYSLLRVFV